MLSDCRGCKYFHLDGCAVNPGYWKVERIVRPNLTPGELYVAEGMLLPCPNWAKAKVPHSLPVVPLETRYCASLLRDRDEQHVPIRAVRRKSWQEQLFDVIVEVAWSFSPLVVFFNSITGKTLFVLGMVLLAVSDPQFPGALPGLPPIPRGYDYAQALCVFVITYQTSDWAFTIKRGEFESTRQMVHHIKFSLLLGVLLLGLMVWGGKLA